MPKIPYTLRHPSGVYKINLTVPKKLQEANAYAGVAKIVESLGTKDYHEAAIAAPIRVGELKGEFEELLNRLETTGSLRASRKRRLTARKSENVAAEQFCSEEYCCFLDEHVDPTKYAQQLAKECFSTLIVDAEANVEGYGTRRATEDLEELLWDARRHIESLSVGMSNAANGLPNEYMTGKAELLAYLNSRGLSYSEEGIGLVARQYDLFRRAHLEVAMRTASRIEEVLECFKSGKVPNSGWENCYDGMFKDITPYSAYEPLQSATMLVPTEAPAANVASTSTYLDPRAEGVTLGEVAARHFASKRTRKVREDGIQEEESFIACVMQIIPPETKLHEITKEYIKEAMLFISRIPHGTKVRGKEDTLKERVEKAWEGGKEPSLVSSRTFTKKMDAMYLLFSYANRNYSYDYPLDFCKTNDITDYELEIDPEGEGREVVDFTVEQLNRYFRLPIYTGHQAGLTGWKKEGDRIDRDSGRYWAPLFMLFHGCRLNEIAQVLVQDVDLDCEIPHINIGIYVGGDKKVLAPKTVKRESSARLLPIHDELIKCGFLDFVRKRKEEGALWLFPEWVDKVVEDWKPGDPIPIEMKRHSKMASKHCLGLRDMILTGEEEAKPNNHSFRHTVRTSLRVAEVDDFKADEMQGWVASDRGDRAKKSVGDSYGNKYLAGIRKTVMSVRHEGLDISHLYLKSV